MAVTWYGAVVGGPSKSPYSTGRQIFNVYCLLWLLLVPCIVFGLIFGLMSFSARASCPWLIWLLALLLVVLCVYLAYSAFDAYQKWSIGEGSYEALLILLLLLMSVFGALVFAAGLGEMNYQSNSKDAYALDKLNAYYNVDPCASSGLQLMDAGRVAFTKSVRLDLSLGTGFRDRQVYCVAPITCNNVSAKAGALGPSYDMWAVGINCCSGQSGDKSFRCKNYDNPRAAGAVRLLDDEQRAYFRLAVQQAEAAYNIQATHPLFFYWVQDPFAEVDASAARSSKFFAMGVGGFFIYQLFIVVGLAFYLIRIHGNEELK
eukprot:TRINITY_DN36946_c0_g1_i1.p1 TRINITY_DN36946_c0_g1~~TRINITY_DN36946_c0_g1_i1.p1  ORF type:complete len:317 (+),score=68.54 TRINITY_DN36946_c0_g1_i1:72-1022(+)